MNGWQPIATCPKDNKARLVWCPAVKCIYVVSWWGDADEPYWLHFGGDHHDRLRDGPSHWMEMPPTPVDLLPGLLPCPFCGGYGSVRFWTGQSLIRCRDCGASTECFEKDDQAGRTAAIAAWNRRVPPPAWSEVHAARARFEMAAKGSLDHNKVDNAGMTRCDYCFMWRRSPCGENCVWGPMPKRADVSLTPRATVTPG